MHLTLFKHQPRTRWGGVPIGLSACWSVREVPGLRVERRRCADAIPGSLPAWVLTSGNYLQWRLSADQVAALEERGEESSDYYLDQQEKMTRHWRMLSCGINVADQVALHFRDSRFVSREEALKALDVWLCSNDVAAHALGR